MTKLMLALACALILPASALAEEKAEPTPEDMIAQMEAQCAANSEAMAARQAETSLYERLGGDEKIHEFTRELMEVHMANDAVRPFVENVDRKKAAYRVAQFIISGTGGEQVYQGPSLEETHAHMNITNADFLNAGGDIMQAMKNMEYGQDEIDEMVCILVALRPHVISSEGGDTGR
jgi:hemoglobin